MRLRAWIKRQGKGAISQLAAASGVSYTTVHAVARDKQRVKHVEIAEKISAATGGAVSVLELIAEPPAPKLKRKPVRRAA